MALKYTVMDANDRIELSTLLEDEAVDPALVKQLQEQLQQAQSENAKALIAKLNSETARNLSQVEVSRVTMQKDAATTAKTLEEAEQVNIENKFLPQTMTENIRISA